MSDQQNYSNDNHGYGEEYLEDMPDSEAYNFEYSKHIYNQDNAGVNNPRQMQSRFSHHNQIGQNVEEYNEARNQDNFHFSDQNHSFHHPEAEHKENTQQLRPSGSDNSDFELNQQNEYQNQYGSQVNRQQRPNTQGDYNEQCKISQNQQGTHGNRQQGPGFQGDFNEHYEKHQNQHITYGNRQQRPSTQGDYHKQYKNSQNQHGINDNQQQRPSNQGDFNEQYQGSQNKHGTHSNQQQGPPIVQEATQVTSMKDMKELERIHELEELEAKRLYCVACDVKFVKETHYWIHNRGLAHYSKMQDFEERQRQQETQEVMHEEEDECDDDESLAEPQPHWNYCEACDLSFFSEGTFLVHANTESHKTSHAHWEAEQKKAGLPKAYKNEKWLAAHEKNLTPFDVGRDGSQLFFCEVCQVSCTGAKCFQAHLEGQKHNKVKRSKSTAELKKHIENFSKDKKKKRQSSIAQQLDRCSLPLIGVDYMTEFQKEDPNVEPKFTCDLCEAKMDPRQVISHLTGIKHRMKYFKYHAIKYYGNLWSLKKVEKTFLGEKYALEIQKEEGRRSMRVRIQLDPFNDGTGIGEQLSQDQYSVDITDGNVRDVDELPGLIPKTLLNKYKEEKSDEENDDSNYDVSVDGLKTGLISGQNKQLEQYWRQNKDTREPLSQDSSSSWHQQSRDSRDPYQHKDDRDLYQHKGDRINSYEGERRDQYGRGYYDRSDYYQDSYSGNSYSRDPYGRYDPYYSQERPGYSRDPSDPYNDPYGYSYGRDAYDNPYYNRDAYADYYKNTPTTAAASSSDPYTRPPPEHYNISQTPGTSSNQTHSQNAMARAEESLDDMLKQFKAKKDAADDAKKQAENSPSKQNYEVADASSAVLKKTSSQATELLAQLGECVVNNEKDAEVALQISNALTQALLGYRIKHLPDEVKTDEVKEKLETLSQAAKHIEISTKIGDTSAEQKLPKLALENTPGAFGTSDVQSIPGLDKVNKHSTSKSRTETNQRYAGYDTGEKTALKNKQTPGGFNSMSSALQFLSESYTEPSQKQKRNSAGYSVTVKNSATIVDRNTLTVAAEEKKSNSKKRVSFNDVTTTTTAAVSAAADDVYKAFYASIDSSAGLTAPLPAEAPPPLPPLPDSGEQVVQKKRRTEMQF